MKNQKTYRVLLSLILAMAYGLVSSVGFAVPYASDVTNDAGVVSFRLNENADNVKIVSGGGAVTNDLGAGIKGLTVTNLGIASGFIKVMVLRSVPAGYSQISSDGFQDNGIFVNKFEHPRGVVVNKNPATPSFGRIYVSCARQGTTGGSFVRETFDGIYLINSDNTVALDTGTTPATAGLEFSTVVPATLPETASPLRLTMGKDDNMLYICDLSDDRGGLWMTDLDVTTGQNALNGIGDLAAGSTTHGSIYAAVVEGTLANSNLKIFTMDEDLTPTRSAWRYDVNGGPFPFEGVNNGLGQAMINSAVDLVKGGSMNYLYASQNRSTGTDAPSIRVFTATGTTITNSLDASRAYLGNPTAADLLRNTTALDISPDGSTLALLRGSVFGGQVLFVPLTNGLFNFAATNSFSLGNSSDNNRDIAYDAAGNIYVVASNAEWLRIYSKGGATLATTGTDGTFTVGAPELLVSVTNSIPTANEQAPGSGQFTIARGGDTSGALTVNYTISGTATAGSDFTALSGSVTFTAGATSTNINVAVLNDVVAEFTETVILTITPSANYGISTSTATVSILDNEPTEVSVMLAQTDSRLLEGFAGAKVGFRVERRGLSSSAITANIGHGGVATGRFTGPATASLGANVATATINITPNNDQIYQGNQTATVSVLSGAGYALAATNTANATVIDDEFPSGTLLFSDNFETPSAGLWTVTSVDFGADSAADFAYDYSQLFVPAAPGGSSTLGLRFRLNEISGLRNAISASPATLSVSNDYRLKFNMWINYNGPMFDGGLGSTFHLNAGVGTTPDHANLGSAVDSDGIWFSISGDGGSTAAAGDVNAYQASTLQNDDSGVYAAGTNAVNSGIRRTTHPFYSLWGNVAAPANQLAAFPSQTGLSGPGNMGISWHSVVITKATNTVTLVIDGIVIATLPADVVPLSTNVFVGYQDIFAGSTSSVPAMSFAIVDNLRVETYSATPASAPNITKIQIVGANVVINFTGDSADAASSFTLQSSSSVTGPYTDNVPAANMTGSSGSYQATVALIGSTRFYRIKR